MNNIRQRIEALKSCIGKKDDESRRKFTETVTYLKKNNSKEVQRMLAKFVDEALLVMQQEIDILKKQTGDIMVLP